MNRYQTLMQEIAEKAEQVNGIFDKAGEEALPKEQYQQVVTLNKEIEEKEYEAKELLDQASAKAANDVRLKELKTPNYKVPFPGSDDDTAPNQKQLDNKGVTRSLADTFLADPEIKGWLGSLNVESRTQFGQSPAARVNGMMKALITGTSDASAGAFVTTDVKPYVDFPFRMLTIRDLITVGQTGSDTVEFPRFVSQANNAAGVAEATSVNDGAKPESDLVYEKGTANVITIAHFMPATKRALADAGQIRTLINSFLMYGLNEELEDQILNGSGVGENFDGIYNAGVQVQAWSSNILTTTRKARTKIKVTGRANPTAWVMHPNDWEEFDLTQDNEARYYYGGPSILGNPRLWGLPLVETEAATENLALIGDFKKAVLWDREAASISVSDSHSDFFVRNLVAILAELRAAFGVLQPTAFCTADLTA